MNVDAQLKSACQDRCAEFGEPPCYEFKDAGPWKPCAACLADAGLPPDPDLIDPNAAVGDLFA